MIVTIFALAVTMAIWGFIQIKAIDEILVEQQVKRLHDLADTVSTYYHHFPTGRGLSALDEALEEHIKTDIRLARIDLFTVVNGELEYIVGAGRVTYDWPDTIISRAMEKSKTQRIEIDTESGPALGLLYPFITGKDSQIFVGVLVFSQTRLEIVSRAKRLLLVSSAGLLIVILLVLIPGYRALIERPLKLIIETIDEFRKGKYVKRIPITRQDEWGQLANHFNAMADEIEQVLARDKELHKHLEERVQEATHKVIQLQKQVTQLQQLTALGYLTATLAHDLGTPLHSIAGLAKLLLEHDTWPQDVARKLELIVQQTQRLNNVIQNVRHATRLPEPHFEEIHVPDLLNETLPLVESLLQKSGIQLAVNIENDIPPLHVDRYRVQTALLNLIQNAWEAMPEGGKLTITARVNPSEHHKISIVVEDTGPGIPPEIRERIFEPFFSTHTEEGLRGLGLAIVQDIVKIHGGTIEIESNPGEGTRFSLNFPLIEVHVPGTIPSELSIS